MLDNRWTYLGLAAVGSVIVVLTLFFSGVLPSESQQSRPTFAGVTQEQLEEQGIQLSLPPQAIPDALPAEQAADRAKAQFPLPELGIKDKVLAILENTQPGTEYRGPVWVFSIDPRDAPGPVGGRIGQPMPDTVTDAFLVFVDARTGRFLFSSEWGHEKPN